MSVVEEHDVLELGLSNAAVDEKGCENGVMQPTMLNCLHFVDSMMVEVQENDFFKMESQMTVTMMMLLTRKSLQRMQ